MNPVPYLSITLFTNILLSLSVLFFVYEISPLFSLLLASSIIIYMFIKQQQAKKEQQKLENQLSAYSSKSIIFEQSMQQKEKELQEKYFIDDLTKLPNKNALINQISEDECYTLIISNIDEFKDINDFYGLEATDSIIKQLANQIASLSLPFENWCYHLHADAFAFLIKGTLSRQEVQFIVHDIEKAIYNYTYYASMNQSVLLSLSFGIAFSHTKTPYNHCLINEANIALSFTSQSTNTWSIYDKMYKDNNDYEKNHYWQKKLKEAIDEDRITPYYQPIVNPTKQTITSYEALMRLIDKNGAAISPYLFLNIAKKSKIYNKLTKIMIAKSFNQYAKSKQPFSLNFSYQDMIDKEVQELLVYHLKKSNIGKNFTAEILESESIVNYDLVKEFVDRIKSYHAHVAIDDFGSGYSNFERLFKLDIDTIKIDGSIIKNIDEDKQMRIITETIVTFAKKTDIKVVAEFVHSKEIMQILHNMGVEEMQGYYFAEPTENLVTEVENISTAVCA